MPLTEMGIPMILSSAQCSIAVLEWVILLRQNLSGSRMLHSRLRTGNLSYLALTLASIELIYKSLARSHLVNPVSFDH